VDEASNLIDLLAWNRQLYFDPLHDLRVRVLLTICLVVDCNEKLLQ